MALFAPLTDAQLADLHATARVRDLRPDEVLLKQGDRADNVYVVLDGTARVDLDGTECGPPIERGECIGELAVLDDAPRSATVTAIGPLRVLVVDADAFRTILHEVDSLRDQVTRVLTRRLRLVNNGWAQLAVDIDVLLEAFYAVQGSGDAQDRRDAIKDAAALLRRLAESAPSSPLIPLHALTPAERRVADLVARGLSNAAVAAELFVSEHTVASHLKHIYVKLGVPSRVALTGVVLRSA